MVRRLPNSLSSEAIAGVWRKSRDHARSTAGAAGFDQVTAAAFKTHLAENVSQMQADLRVGRYCFQPLRLAPVRKASGGYRIIAIPTVRDRLLQRCLLQHLEMDRNFSASSPISYGFVRGRKLSEAQKAALLLRQSHHFALQVDIIKFFDNIDRNLIKSLISKSVRSKLIAELLSAAVDCELEKPFGKNAALPEANGIKRGRGLRQGMPVSPVLSNLLLKRFDWELVKAGLHAVRYADDLIVFGSSRAECLDALALMKARLVAVGLTIPELEDQNKTKILEPSHPCQFLGVEIRKFAEGYRLCAPKGRVVEISRAMQQAAKLKWCIENKRNLGDLLRYLDSFIAGHRASMAVINDPNDFFQRLDSEKYKAVKALLVEMFGPLAESLDDKRSAVLGIRAFPVESVRSAHRVKKRFSH